MDLFLESLIFFFCWLIILLNLSKFPQILVIYCLVRVSWLFAVKQVFTHTRIGILVHVLRRSRWWRRRKCAQVDVCGFRGRKEGEELLFINACLIKIHLDALKAGSRRGGAGSRLQPLTGRPVTSTRSQSQQRH